MARNVVLVGMMGVGKSTVGRELAARLERPFVETDALVEQRAGTSISEIFSTGGEAVFRRYERDAVRDVAARSGHVVSVGGGAVLDDENAERLRDTGVLVLLDAPAAVLTERVGRDPDRPLLGEDPGPAIERLLAERGPRYDAVADHRVDVTESPEAVVTSIVTWLSAETDVLTDADRERCP